MADILIRGMEMPKSCDECRLFNECWCMALGIENWRKSYNKPPEGERLPDCPLVPLPEGHGRLIDGTELYDVLDGGFDVDLDDLPETKDAILSMIQSTETIVPAEGGTDNVPKTD